MKKKSREKLIYIIPVEKKFYTVILKNIQNFHDKHYTIIQVKNLRHFFQNHKNEKFVMISYFVSTIFIDLKIYDDLHIYKNIYNIIDIKKFINDLEEKYELQEEKIQPNLTNPNLTCSYCKKMMSNNTELLNHLETCKTFQYTLFGEPIPKELKVKKVEKSNKYELDFKKKNEFVLNEIKSRNLFVKIENNNLSFRWDTFLKPNGELPQIIYIAQSEACVKTDLYKIGGTTSVRSLKQRFSSYNVGRIQGMDTMKCLYIFPVSNFSFIENYLKTDLLKDYHYSNEIYDIKLEKLLKTLSPLCCEIN